ncbi:unnamed protein product [Schistosoma margrebowiei]|uniref:Uncharacterized protein n=1 Tax=Schistosoma margrebowiei TaxID=48269 RepID=A0A183MFX5_9TREM|nr:unnamed protein product [Schistosoma margrebowiei]
MVVGGSQQETLDLGFVLLGTRQQGVPLILRELVLPGGFNLMSPSFTLICQYRQLHREKKRKEINKSSTNNISKQNQFEKTKNNNKQNEIIN